MFICEYITFDVIRKLNVRALFFSVPERENYGVTLTDPAKY